MLESLAASIFVAERAIIVGGRRERALGGFAKRGLEDEVVEYTLSLVLLLPALCWCQVSSAAPFLSPRILSGSDPEILREGPGSHSQNDCEFLTLSYVHRTG